jgi:hypothetical protein
VYSKTTDFCLSYEYDVTIDKNFRERARADVANALWENRPVNREEFVLFLRYFIMVRVNEKLKGRIRKWEIKRDNKKYECSLFSYSSNVQCNRQ